VTLKFRYLILAFLFSPFNTQAATQDSINLVQQMYVAYYGRPGDPGGINFWAEKFDSSTNLDAVLDSFGNSQEYSDNFGSLDNETLVNGLFQQMYNRDADPGGLSFYVGRLESGEATLASIAKQIADGSQDSDLDSLNNKISVANSFTEQLEADDLSYSNADIANAQAILVSVSNLAESVTSALDLVTEWVPATIASTFGSSQWGDGSMYN